MVAVVFRHKLKAMNYILNINMNKWKPFCRSGSCSVNCAMCSDARLSGFKQNERNQKHVRGKQLK